MKADWTRRDFNKLSVAAFGGMVAGVGLAGCGDGEKDKPTTKPTDKPADKPAGGDATSLLLQEPHVCRGLNTCKGKGACKTATSACKGMNECAGLGGCATVEKHECGGQNKCKGQGGCGETAGQNACSEKGKCAVPIIHEDAWTKARAAFEKAYEAKNQKKPGGPPEPAEG